MAFAIEYFHGRVLAEIESWPVDIVADYARLMELLAQHGPNLRMPHSRAMGAVCSNCVRVEDQESVVHFIVSS